eukprot:6175166-Pleurochrysis_carterae.AAC.5
MYAATGGNDQIHLDSQSAGRGRDLRAHRAATPLVERLFIQPEEEKNTRKSRLFIQRAVKNTNATTPFVSVKRPSSPRSAAAAEGCFRLTKAAYRNCVSCIALFHI